MFSDHKVHAGNNGFDDLTLASAAFSPNIEEHLIPLGCIMRMISPSYSGRKHSFDNKSLLSIKREDFADQCGKSCTRRVIADSRAKIC